MISWNRVLIDYSYEQLVYLGIIHPDELDSLPKNDICYVKELFRK